MPCLDCGQPSNGHTRCSACNRNHEKTRRPHTTARGYGTAWVRLVKQAIDAQPFCSHCGTEHDLTGDHIDPTIRQGPDLADNVQVLCRACNSRKHNKQS